MFIYHRIHHFQTNPVENHHPSTVSRFPSSTAILKTPRCVGSAPASRRNRTHLVSKQQQNVPFANQNYTYVILKYNVCLLCNYIYIYILICIYVCINMYGVYSTLFIYYLCILASFTLLARAHFTLAISSSIIRIKI